MTQSVAPAERAVLDTSVVIADQMAPIPHPPNPGNGFRTGVECPQDPRVSTTVDSSFHGTPYIDACLRVSDVEALVSRGATSAHSRETTARFGGDLGHWFLFVPDAMHTFDRAHHAGEVVQAEMLAW